MGQILDRLQAFGEFEVLDMRYHSLYQMHTTSISFIFDTEYSMIQCAVFESLSIVCLFVMLVYDILRCTISS